jgi:hypothetical protein
MKARVKETGEIVDVHDCSNDMYVEKFGELSGRLFHITELDFDNLESPDYWTRLEHQYAGMAMQGILSNQEYVHSLVQRVASREILNLAEGITKHAEQLAHALVEKMKEQAGSSREE